MSARAIEHAYEAVHGDADAEIATRFRKLLGTGIFYYLAIEELEKLKVHKSVVIDNEISNEHLDLYTAFCSSSLFPPQNRKLVTTLVGDGTLKLKPRCAVEPQKRAGGPRQSEHSGSAIQRLVHDL